MPKYPAAVTDATISTSDITTNNASTSKHGFLKKLDNSATNFMNGQGAWAAPAGGAVATDAIFDAKGDLAAGTGADTAAKVTVGTNTYLLTADSAQSTGLRWQNIGWTEITKASDESVTSSTTLQNDDEFLFTATSAAVYEIYGIIIYVSPVGGATPNIKVGFGEDTNTFRGVMQEGGMTTAGAATWNSNICANDQARAFGTGTTNRAIVFHGHYIGAGGTFRMVWAQNTSDANAVTVKAGSILRYRRIL